MLDPLEPLRREMEQLDVLLNAKLLTWDEYAEAMLRVQERMDEMLNKTEKTGSQMDQFAVQAARSIQSAFADYLFDPFSRGVDGMLYGFIQAVHRMVSEALAAKLASSCSAQISPRVATWAGCSVHFLRMFSSFTRAV